MIGSLGRAVATDDVLVTGALSDHAASEASRRHLLARAAQVGLLMRHTVTLGVALIGLVDPLGTVGSGGRVLLAAAAVWSGSRLATRSPRARWLVGDYLMAISVCLAIPMLVPDSAFYLSNTVPQAIAGTAVVSFSVSVAARISAALTVGIAACYAVGAASVIGWEELGSVAALSYFAVQWVTASVIRFMLLRLANAIDSARSGRQEAEVNEQVTMAVRNYEREQLALLHDTAASTLLMVGQDTSVRPDRFAAQARRDLELIRIGAWVAPPPRLDVVAAVRECSQHLSVPVTLAVPTELWLPGDLALPVIAAAREAITNIERHARASRVRIQILDRIIRIEDDGVGFDVAEPRTGHGLTGSIIERMRRAGGQARVASAPGEGTVTELRWPAQHSDATPAEAAADDPDGLVARTRTRYGLAIACYSLANLAITVPPAVAATGHPPVEITLAVLAAFAALIAFPGILAGRWVFAPLAVVVLIAVAIAQPATLPHHLLVGYAHWAQGAVGWCLVPLVLGLPTRVGAAILAGTWVAASAVVLTRDPSAAAVVNVGLGTASILSVQLFALIFNGLMREAAAAVDSETRAYQNLIKRDRVAQALREEYQRRYASIVDNVVPLLDALTRCDEVDAATRRRARAEWRRLRALFDQATVFDHELMRRLRPIIDDAEARHIDVVVDVAGALPEVETAEIETATDALNRVLSYAETSARLVIVPSPTRVEISLVIDVAPDSAVHALRIEGATVTVAEAELWCVLRCSAIDVGRRQS